MLLALTDHLRCTGDHAESWLVARADIVEARHLVRGVLGCPVCGIERAVEGGVVWWEGTPVAPAPAADRDLVGDALARVGALIGYTDSLQPFVLSGRAGLAASGLSGIADAPMVLLDPPDDRAAPFATIIRGAPRLPFGAASCRGIVLDDIWADPARASHALSALVAGGRLVAPATLALPVGARELARDDREWVAEREGGLFTVPLARAPRPTRA